MSQPNLWFLPRAFFPHGGHGGGELPAFPAPSHFNEGDVMQASGVTCAARSRCAVLLFVSVNPVIPVRSRMPPPPPGIPVGSSAQMSGNRQRRPGAVAPPFTSRSAITLALMQINILAENAPPTHKAS